MFAFFSSVIVVEKIESILVFSSTDFPKNLVPSVKDGLLDSSVLNNLRFYQKRKGFKNAYLGSDYGF